jgi:hypothetical protein
VLQALHGALRIVGGMVQVAAGITRLLAVTALKAAEAVQGAVEATENEDNAKFETATEVWVMVFSDE